MSRSDLESIREQVNCDEQVIDDAALDSQAERYEPREPIDAHLRSSAVLFFLGP
jgi:hypothetical protein